MISGIIFLFSIPLAIYKRFTRRYGFYVKNEAIKISIVYGLIVSVVSIAVICLIVYMNSGAFYIEIPVSVVIGTAAGISGYFFLYQDKFFLAGMAKGTDVRCSNCQSVYPHGVKKCPVCGAKINNGDDC